MAFKKSSRNKVCPVYKLSFEVNQFSRVFERTKNSEISSELQPLELVKVCCEQIQAAATE